MPASKPMGRRPKKPIEIGSIFGEFLVLKHDHDDLWIVRCRNLSGHTFPRTTRLLRAKHPTHCPQCRREEKLATVIHAVFGRLEVIGMSENNASGHAVALVKCVDCGYERTAELRELRREKRNDGKLYRGISGRSCPKCKELKLEQAKLNPPQWSSETSNEVIAAIRRGVCACVLGDERERIEDESVSASLLELMQFPNLNEMNHKQLLGTAFRLGRRVALSTVQAQRQDDYRQVKPVTEDFAEDGATVDMFDKIIVEPAPSEVDELQQQAVNSLGSEDKAWLLEYGGKSGVRSKRDKERQAALVARCRQVYMAALNEMEGDACHRMNSNRQTHSNSTHSGIANDVGSRTQHPPCRGSVSVQEVHRQTL
jgi:Zn ribbon nucleic-acid-binding protein